MVTTSVQAQNMIKITAPLGVLSRTSRVGAVGGRDLRREAGEGVEVDVRDDD